MRVPNRFIICSLSVALLTGFSKDDTISKVKNYPYPGETTQTVSQLLDHRNFCVQPSWSAIPLAEGEALVTYQCELRKLTIATKDNEKINTEVRKEAENLRPLYVATFIVNHKKVTMQQCGTKLEHTKHDINPVAISIVSDVNTCIEESKRDKYSAFYIKHMRKMYSHYFYNHPKFKGRLLVN